MTSFHSFRSVFVVVAMRATILVVDDSKSMRRMIVDSLKDAGYDCRSAEDVDTALTALSGCEFSLVLCDIEMPGRNGIFLLNEIRTTRPDTFVVMLTGVTDPETVMHCIHLGANDYLMKPFTVERLLLTVRNALRQRKLYLEHRSYEETLEQKVLEQTEQIRASLLEKALLTKEMEIAGAIHAALVPRFIPPTPRLSFAAHYLSAGPLGGDYFDIFHRGDGLVDVVIADVAGHNIGSALIVAQLRGALRVHASASRLGCAEMLKLINESFYEDLTGAELFVSMLYLRLDEVRMQLRYACAGHNPGVMLRPDGSVLELDAEGMIIGVAREVDFEEKALPLEGGSRLVLYTDGIVEAENGAGELFGLARFVASLSEAGGGEPGVLIDAALSSMKRFTSAEPLKDDLTVVVVGVD